MQVYSIGEALRFREQERDNFVVIDKAAFRAMEFKAAQWDAQWRVSDAEQALRDKIKQRKQSNAD